MVNREQRILQVLHNGGFSELTFLQKSIIPLALDGENIIAETGVNAGKTVSYIIPSIINLDDYPEPGLKILVIVPSVEDVKKVSEQFALFCREGAEKVSFVSFREENNTKGELAVLEKKPDILISTPEKIIDHIRLGNFNIDSILTCIVDCGDDQYNGFSNDIEFIHSAFSVLTRFWVFTKDREMIPIFHHLLIDPQIIYSDRGIKSSTSERQEEKMEFSADQEAKYAELIKKMVKNIKEEEDANEMNQYKKLVKRNVPFTMRGYFSAYLFKTLMTNTKPAHAPSQNKADKDYKTLFFNIGRTRGLNPQAMSRFIAATAEVDSAEIGQIRVHDNYSFVDIAEPFVQKVIDGLNSKQYRGRTLAVNFAKKNSDTPKA
jgi:superfamily II DNA/RNA helicase